MPRSRVSLTTSIVVVAFCFLHACLSPLHAVAVMQGTAIASAEERERGIALYQQGEFADAAKVFRKALSKNKSDHEGWYYLGMTLLQQQPKEVKNAAKAFETAVKLRPGFAAAHLGLGYVFLLQNKPSDAIREASAALNIDPNLRDAHYFLGVQRLRAGANEEALKHAEAIIKLDPKFASAYLLKSQALTGFPSGPPYLKEQELTESRNTLYREAAAALEKYLLLDTNTKEKQTWTEQLESLRFYLEPHREDAGPDRIYSGPGLTTKARVLTKPEPQYTDAARHNLVKGTVKLRCIFASDGSVRHILVVNGLPYGLTERAVSAAKLIKFVPATIDGRPVSIFMQVEYYFNLY